MSKDELLAQVLRLPRNERAKLAEELLSSLEEQDGEAVATAWAPELARRSREIAEGAVEAVEWAPAKGELLKELEQRRARRAAS